MKKLLFMLMLLSISSYGQDLSASFPRSDMRHQLNMYTEANTGTLVDNTDGLFAGNELILALEYRYNFDTVSWLSIYSKLSFLSIMNFNNINVNLVGPNAKPNNEGIVDPKYQFNGFNSASVIVDYFETGLRFGEYGLFSVRAGRGGENPTSATPGMLLKFHGYYPLELASNQKLYFTTEFELNPFPVGEKLNTGDPNLATEGRTPGTYVDLISFGTRYQVLIGRGFSFSTGVNVRTSGHRYKLANSATGDIWESDTEEAFRNNLHVRWDNTFYYEYNNSLLLWTQVRYQAERVAIAEESDSIYELTKQHEVFLKFGVNYYFNFAK